MVVAVLLSWQPELRRLASVAHGLGKLQAS